MAVNRILPPGVCGERRIFPASWYYYLPMLHYCSHAPASRMCLHQPTEYSKMVCMTNKKAQPFWSPGWLQPSRDTYSLPDMNPYPQKPSDLLKHCRITTHTRNLQQSHKTKRRFSVGPQFSFGFSKNNWIQFWVCFEAFALLLFLFLGGVPFWEVNYGQVQRNPFAYSVYSVVQMEQIPNIKILRSRG